MSTPSTAPEDPYDRFAPYYDLVYKGLVDYAGDTAYLRTAFERYADLEGPVRRVIDAGCGSGTHALLLAEAGFDVEGVDVSAELVRVARGKADVEPTRVTERVRFHEADMAEWLPEGEHDAVVCMFGAFNYLVEDARAGAFLDLAAARTRPGGVLVFEFWNPIGVEPQQSWIRMQAPDGRVLYRLSESRFDSDRDVVALRFRFLVLQGDRVESTWVEDHDLRARTRAHVRRLLDAHGWEPVTFTEGGRDGKSFKPAAEDTFRIMAIARRRA